MKRRGSGILLHLTSLPSAFGIGDLGPGAYRFVDFLVDTKQRYWQILPLNPTDRVHNNSPYHTFSAFGFNPLLISPERLSRDELLDKSDLESPPGIPIERIDYGQVTTFKAALFNNAFNRFQAVKVNEYYERFCAENSHWLDDFALFCALKSHFNGKSWFEWPQDIRDRQPEALVSAKRELYELCGKEKFLQYAFFTQWSSLKTYCNQRGIQIIGDMPIYVNYDSVDVWVNPELFKLDEKKQPAFVAGVPPDYFSDTGQLWGNPVFNWDVLKQRRYDWWIQRMSHNFKLFDFLRMDHFRGYVKYWEVPSHEKTALDGKWVDVPAYDFFDTLLRRFPCFPIFAEDLGYITPDVREVMSHFKLPGMKVILFAFGESFPKSAFLPHHYIRDCVAYTGTHDNNTIRGWFENEATDEDKKRLFQYLGRKLPAAELHWELIRLLMMSAANTTIFPMQDNLGLNNDTRMNLPGSREGNWQWRLLPELLTDSIAKRLREMTVIYDRA